MSRNFKVTFNSPQSGFMSVGLRAGAQEFAAAVACGPYDSLRDLLAGLATLLRGEREEVAVRWNCEPDELDFQFRARGGRLSFEVIHYPGRDRAGRAARRVFSYVGPLPEVCRSFLRTLEEVRGDAEIDEFARNWRREFPAPELAALAQALRESQRPSRAPAR